MPLNKLYGGFTMLLFCGQLLIADCFKYKITSWNKCVEPNDAFIKLIDVSIAECVDACVRRQTCKSVGYRRRFKLCELHKEEILCTKGNEESCIFIERKDMNTTDAGICNCAHVGHVCDLVSGFCELKECGHLDLLNGKVNGNMHFIGAKIRVTCDQGYKERNGITHSTCNSTGDWEPTPVCEMILTPPPQLPPATTTTEIQTTTTTPSTKTIKEYYIPYTASWSRNYSMFNLHNDGVIIDNITSITFEAKGGHDAHVLLQNDRNAVSGNVVEIVIGGWTNGQSVIRTGGVDESPFLGNVLDANSYRPFWISWDSGCVKVGKGNDTASNIIMSWCGLTYSIAGMRISYCCNGGGYFKFTI